MNAVMLSIYPEWCVGIASGEKTVELKKAKPKELKPPFRCYIYETRGKTHNPLAYPYDFLALHGRGAVIGEFICDNICVVDAEHEPALGYAIKGMPVDDFFDGIYMTVWDVLDYLSAGKNSPLEYRTGYGWHISDLVIYEKPLPLSAFRVPEALPGKHMTIAPQSWCYVEEIDVRGELEEGAG